MTLAERVDFGKKLSHAPLIGWIYPTVKTDLSCLPSPGFAGLNGYMDSDVDISSIRQALRRVMKEKGMAPTTLSVRVGNNKSLVKDLLEKTDDVRLSTLVKLAGALDVSVDRLLARPRVPVAGHIGAGGVIIFEDIGEEIEPDQTVPAAPGVSGKLVALLVRGDSMLPKYKDGDIIYIQRQHDGVMPEYIGDDCAIRLATGETYLKQLTKGTRDGVFTLRSLNAADIEDVEVEWATPVIFVMPARARTIME